MCIRDSPCLHFEFNEAWLDASSSEGLTEEELLASSIQAVTERRRYSTLGLDGEPRVVVHGGRANNGAFVRDGEELWYDTGGELLRRRLYSLGRLVEEELP